MKLVTPKIGHELPPDARFDLFVNTQPNPLHQPASRGHMELLFTVGIGKTGSHPKMGVRFAREGFEPTTAAEFYQQ
jgi:hypothetical protein